MSLWTTIWSSTGKHIPERAALLSRDGEHFNRSNSATNTRIVKLFCQFLWKGGEVCDEGRMLTKWIQGQTVRRVWPDVNTAISWEENRRVESTEKREKLKQDSARNVFLSFTCGWHCFWFNHHRCAQGWCFIFIKLCIVNTNPEFYGSHNLMLINFI